MLEQLVYTRGKPRIDLTAGGTQIPTDGFGVSNISDGLTARLSGAEQLRFVVDRAAVKNGSNEVSVGLFNSYEYTRVDSDTFFLSFEYSRPCSTDPSVPGSSRLNGIFVKQCLVGAPGGYPYEWIGADVWTAWRVPDADYRRDSLPPPLPSVPDRPSGGSIREADVDAFLADGRFECARDALSFLLQQFALPEEDRRVLLIRDTPDNVALWTAALQSSLSPRMAREITFVTNRSRLNIQPEPTLFAYGSRTGPDGHPVRTRRPYCMIVGYHPKDPSCTGLTPGTNARFVLLNGANRTLSFRNEANEEETAFLTAALRRDPSAQAFLSRPYIDLPLETVAAALPGLFAAEEWLSGGEEEQYEIALRNLRNLSRVDPGEDRSFLPKLVGRAFESLARYLETDECRNWTLASMCAPLAEKVGREDELTSLLLSYLTRNLFSADDASRLTALERSAASGSLPACMRPVLDELFSGQYMALLTDRLSALDTMSVAALTRLFLGRVSELNIPDPQILRSSSAVSFLRSALISLSSDGTVLRDVLSQLTGRHELMEALAVQVTGELGQRSAPSRATWLQTIFTIPGFDPLSLYERLRSANEIEPAALENLLRTILDQPGSVPRSVMATFRDLFRSGAAADGTELCRAVIRRTAPEDLAFLIDDIRDLGLPAATQCALLREIDTGTAYPNEQQDTRRTLRALQTWSRDLPPEDSCLSTVAELYGFCRDFCRAEDLQDALDVTRRCSDSAPRLYPDRRYFRSECFRQMVRHAGSFRSAELHAAVLTMFDQSVFDLESYVDAYVSLLIPDEESMASGILRALSRKADPGLEQASSLLRAARGLLHTRGSEVRRECSLICQYTVLALERRGERRLERDLTAYEKADPGAADELRRQIDLWKR